MRSLIKTSLDPPSPPLLLPPRLQWEEREEEERGVGGNNTQRHTHVRGGGGAPKVSSRRSLSVFRERERDNEFSSKTWIYLPNLLFSQAAAAAGFSSLSLSPCLWLLRFSALLVSQLFSPPLSLSLFLHPLLLFFPTFARRGGDFFSFRTTAKKSPGPQLV